MSQNPPHISSVISGFNHYPKQSCFLLRPERYHELATQQHEFSRIARGQGSSYGDAALNENELVVLTERLDRFIAFDEKNGLLTAEAGITLKKILELIIPRGWFLPVTPGTQWTSLGGCVAADVHGKNHYRVGSFSQFVSALTLVKSDGSVSSCSPQENSEEFWATVGGMGLTGMIETVTLQLMPITSCYLLASYQTTESLAQALDALSADDRTSDYAVAWLDLLNEPFGRGIIMKARHAAREDLPTMQQDQALTLKEKNRLTLPCYFPNMAFNRFFLRGYNKRYFQQRSQRSQPSILYYEDYFYPLDSIKHWERFYGRRGFIQYQCVVPHNQARESLSQLLAYIRASAYPVYLATLKYFGSANQAPLSFPMSGYTLALDFPMMGPGLFNFLDNLDQQVVEQGGRVYLAKDARLKPDRFRAMYPNYSDWLAIKNKVDPEHRFNSSLARRLEIYPKHFNNWVGARGGYARNVSRYT